MGSFAQPTLSRIPAVAPRKPGFSPAGDGGEHFSKPDPIVLSMTAPAERWKAASLSKSSSVKGGEILPS